MEILNGHQALPVSLLVLESRFVSPAAETNSGCAVMEKSVASLFRMTWLLAFKCRITLLVDYSPGYVSTEA